MPRSCVVGDDIFIKSYTARYRPMREHGHKWGRSGVSIHSADYRKWKIMQADSESFIVNRVDGWFPMVRVQEEHVNEAVSVKLVRQDVELLINSEYRMQSLRIVNDVRQLIGVRSLDDVEFLCNLYYCQALKYHAIKRFYELLDGVKRVNRRDMWVIKNALLKIHQVSSDSSDEAVKQVVSVMRRFKVFTPGEEFMTNPYLAGEIQRHGIIIGGPSAAAPV